MKIKIEKQSDHYRADCLDMPGRPPVGLGETPEMAVACLFWRLLFESPGGPREGRWVDHLKQQAPIVVDDKVWQWPASYGSGQPPMPALEPLKTK